MTWPHTATPTRTRLLTSPNWRANGCERFWKTANPFLRGDRAPKCQARSDDPRRLAAPSSRWKSGAGKRGRLRPITCPLKPVPDARDSASTIGHGQGRIVVRGYRRALALPSLCSLPLLELGGKRTLVGVYPGNLVLVPDQFPRKVAIRVW